MKLLFLDRDRFIIRYLLTVYVCIGYIKGYPIAKKDVENADQKVEKRFPNGTVIGKYVYKDNDGNPIHIKYYADDSGYGVELKSIKTMQSNPEMVHEQEAHTKSTFTVNTDLGDGISDKAIFDPIYDHRTTGNPFENLDKETKTTKAKYKASPDYEVFMDNDLKAPKQCGQDRVHVYFDNNKRKARNTLSEFDVLKYCEQVFS